VVNAKAACNEWLEQKLLESKKQSKEVVAIRDCDTKLYRLALDWQFTVHGGVYFAPCKSAENGPGTTTN